MKTYVATIPLIFLDFQCRTICRNLGCIHLSLEYLLLDLESPEAKQVDKRIAVKHLQKSFKKVCVVGCIELFMYFINFFLIFDRQKCV